MEFPDLEPVIQRLITKYQAIPYAQWVQLYEEDERFSDYADEQGDDDAYWQAHTDVLELDVDVKGKFANVSLIVYPNNVHSMPPAPYIRLIVYESGRVEIESPFRTVTHVQNSVLPKLKRAT